MTLAPQDLPNFALRLKSERKHQGLSRAQAAAVCGVSPSFIRDAEQDPGSCSLLKLLSLANGLGLRLNVEGWQVGEIVE